MTPRGPLAAIGGGRWCKSIALSVMFGNIFSRIASSDSDFFLHHGWSRSESPWAKEFRLVGWMVLDQAPYSLGIKVLRWNSQPVPRATRAKVKRPIAHQPASQGIEPGTTESADREESPEPPAPQGHLRTFGLGHSPPENKRASTV